MSRMAYACKAKQLLATNHNGTLGRYAMREIEFNTWHLYQCNANIALHLTVSLGVATVLGLAFSPRTAQCSMFTVQMKKKNGEEAPICI